MISEAELQQLLDHLKHLQSIGFPSDPEELFQHYQNLMTAMNNYRDGYNTLGDLQKSRYGKYADEYLLIDLYQCNVFEKLSPSQRERLN